MNGLSEKFMAEGVRCNPTDSEINTVLSHIEHHKISADSVEEVHIKDHTIDPASAPFRKIIIIIFKIPKIMEGIKRAHLMVFEDSDPSYSDLQYGTPEEI